MGLDITELLHPSVDLYGGGGLVMSMGDLARFWTALFDGELYDEPATLVTMLGEPSSTDGEGVGMGVFKTTVSSREGWEHSGFWGTYGAHFPDTGVSIAIAFTAQGVSDTADPFGYLEGVLVPAVLETVAPQP